MFLKLGCRTSIVVHLPCSNQTKKICYCQVTILHHLLGEQVSALPPVTAEMALLNWIAVNSRLCAAHFSSSVKVNQNKTLFVMSLYAPTNSSEGTAKEEFHDEFNRLLNMGQSSDIVMVAGDFNAQLSQLSTSELGLGGRFTLRSKRTDNGDRLLHRCSTYGLFLANTNFGHKGIHRATWR